MRVSLNLALSHLGSELLIPVLGLLAAASTAADLLSDEGQVVPGVVREEAGVTLGHGLVQKTRVIAAGLGTRGVRVRNCLDGSGTDSYSAGRCSSIISSKNKTTS